MRWFSYTILCLLFMACNKESISLDLVELNSQTNNAIYDITFVDNNTAYFCGGELWQSGVVGKSTDGGNTWEIVLDSDNILFAVDFKNINEGVAVGFSGRTWRTKDAGVTWTLTENAPDYPVLSDVKFVSNDSLIIAAGFNYYSGGFVNYFFENQNYTDSLINQDMQALHFFDGQEGVMAGYGAVFKTYDAGKSWIPNSVKGDYFKSVSFNDQGEGLLIGYQGKIFSSEDKGVIWEKNSKKASFFTTKGNLESVDIEGGVAFVAGQNASLLFSENFLDGSNWVKVETPYNNDYLKVCLINSSQGFISGSNGLLFKFNY